MSRQWYGDPRGTRHGWTEADRQNYINNCADSKMATPATTTPAPSTTPAAGGLDLGGVFENIPTSYLLIGGAAVLYFLLKKK